VPPRRVQRVPTFCDIDARGGPAVSRETASESSFVSGGVRAGRPFWITHAAGNVRDDYGCLVSTALHVRLSDELVNYIDAAVVEGRATSRSDFVARLVAREARRHRAEQDFIRLAEQGALQDEEALAIARAAAATGGLDD
jgi:Arc/MetJ-type ribon-helix-helix transcriptional regulator